MSDDDWEAQRIFRAVLREGSLSGGARALGLAQPTVRRRIEALESGLGVALFTRHPNGLTPTEAALALAEHVDAMAMAADAFRRAASADVNSTRGIVRVSASEIVALELLPPIVADIRARYPDLTVIVSASNRTEDLLHREADIAVRMVRPEQQGLVARRIGTMMLGLYARPDYLDRVGRPENAEDLPIYGLIGPELDNVVLRGVRAGGTRISPADFAVRTDSDVVQLALIRAGAGIGVCQQALADHPVKLERLLPDAFEYPLETWIVMHEDLRTTRRVRVVFDALAAGLARHTRKAPVSSG